MSRMRATTHLFRETDARNGSLSALAPTACKTLFGLHLMVLSRMEKLKARFIGKEVGNYILQVVCVD